MKALPHVKRQKAAGKPGERGSALLIVFVFAAMVAIMLYMEMPVAVFESQRQKEQLLIDRGNEYAHAVKLFVRKLGTYPASMDALEKTNQMRFLRHRYKDPFTGKDDWRLLHAGPNGMLIDSKVKPTGTGQNGNGTSGTGTQNGSAGNPNAASGSTFGSSFGTTNTASGSTFGSNTSNFSSSSDSTPSVVVPPLPQRAPAVAANGGGPAAPPTGDQNPLAPLLPPGQAEANTSGAGQTATAGQETADSPGQNSNAFGGTGNAASPQGTTGNSAPGTSTTGTGMGTLNSGGIAGVASKAKGHTIKVVNDQTDYSLWEFYYDPTKDATTGVTNALGAMGAQQQANQQQNGFGQNSQQSGFGTSSPFGSSNSSGTSSPFGSSTGTSGTTSTTPNNSTPPVAPSPQVSNPQ